MANPADLLGKRLLSRYKLTRILGEGGMGVVFEARELSSERLVAVKVLHMNHARVSNAFRRFQQEVRTAAMVGRPHVTEVYDVGILATGEPFFVMEKVEGDTLRRRITRDRWLSLKDVVSIFTQLLTTLEAVHAKGIIHRDIKPENIILSTGRNGGIEIKLIDFGVAKLVLPHAGRVEITSTGVVVGTVWYASPEQVSGTRDLDARVDLWSTGICMIEALTGRRPFEAVEPLRLMMDIVQRPHPRVLTYRADVPPDVDVIIAKALQKSRDKRYLTAHAFRRDLVDMWTRYRKVMDEQSSRPPADMQPVPGYTDSDALATDGTAVELPLRRFEAPPPPPPSLILARTQTDTTRTPRA